MTPRAQARAVLEEAREILAARLAEQVLEASEAILDDARGDSYMSEIDEVYDRIGLKLVHVSQMLSHFPAEEAAEPEAEPAAAPLSAEPARSGAILLGRIEPAEETAASSGKTIILPQLLRPRLALPRPAAPPRSATDPLTLLAVLAAQVQAGELADAAETTAELLELDLPTAAACVRVYHRRQTLDPEFVAGSMLLVPAVEAGRMDDALPLISYCFGLASAEAVRAYHRLRAKLGDAA